MKVVFALVMLVAWGGAGCTPGEPGSVPALLTERQRDSVLARSALPGAVVVGRALEVSDRATDHAAAAAAADSLFR